MILCPMSLFWFLPVKENQKAMQRSGSNQNPNPLSQKLLVFSLHGFPPRQEPNGPDALVAPGRVGRTKPRHRHPQHPQPRQCRVLFQPTRFKQLTRYRGWVNRQWKNQRKDRRFKLVGQRRRPNSSVGAVIARFRRPHSGEPGRMVPKRYVMLVVFVINPVDSFRSIDQPAALPFRVKFTRIAIERC